MLTKHSSVITLLATLRARLGSDAFAVFDHWDADLYAVGIARPELPERLVYISTWQKPAGTYFCECEFPDSLSHRVSEDNINLERLLEVVKAHLEL